MSSYKQIILTIGTVILLIFTGYYIVNFPFGDSYYQLVSALTLTSTALIVYYFLIKSIGMKRGLITILGLSLFGVIIESIGVSTGFPYGGFEYTTKIGYKLGELIPWNIFFVWAPLVIGSVAISKFTLKKPAAIIFTSVVLLVLFDMIFDPVAVQLDFWIWDKPGVYYGIPFSNYLGWVFSGLLSTVFTYYLLRDLSLDQSTARKLSLGLFVNILTWTVVSIWTGLLIPLLIGIVLSIFFYLLLFTKKVSFPKNLKKNVSSSTIR